MQQYPHEYFMARCLELATRGIGYVAPNPMVGAVLVYQDKIIGEGYHEEYGKPHAEVNCINEALTKAPELIAKSTLYVSLEPCAHYGKTPPCADLIIKHHIPKVVIGCRDNYAEVNGRGIERLQNAGVKVVKFVVEQAAISLNKRFFLFHAKKRPYIILKWAQTNDGFIGSNNHERLFISNSFSNRLVHKWRSEEAAIMVGANTALLDNPLLDNRHWYGRAPLKILLDPQLRVLANSHIYTSGNRLIVYNFIKNEIADKVVFVNINKDTALQDLLHDLYKKNVQSIFIEGGKQLIQSFIDANLWDEARVITNSKISIGVGLKAPVLSAAFKIKMQPINNDYIEFFKNRENLFI